MVTWMLLLRLLLASRALVNHGVQRERRTPAQYVLRSDCLMFTYATHEILDRK